MYAVALAMLLLVASTARAEEIAWMTMGDFPAVVGWEVCDGVRGCAVVEVAQAFGATAKDGLHRNIYTAEADLLPGEIAWVRAVLPNGFLLPESTPRIWCSPFDSNADNYIGISDFVALLRRSGGLSEFQNLLPVWVARCSP